MAMAADHLVDGIRVNCVNPGTADTPWVARDIAAAADPEAERAALVARQPMGRLVTAEEVGVRHRLPGQPAGRVDDRGRAERRRRHAEPAHAPGELTPWPGSGLTSA